MKTDALLRLTGQLGAILRTERKRRGLTQTEVARRAGMARQKLIQVEQGKPGVAFAAYAAAMDALDLVPAAKPAEVRLDDHPQLKRLAWNRTGTDTIAERDALALYERYWDQVDVDRMSEQEHALVRRLADKYGHGILHV